MNAAICYLQEWCCCFAWRTHVAVQSVCFLLFCFFKSHQTVFIRCFVSRFKEWNVHWQKTLNGDWSCYFHLIEYLSFCYLCPPPFIYTGVSLIPPSVHLVFSLFVIISSIKHEAPDAWIQSKTLIYISAEISAQMFVFISFFFPSFRIFCNYSESNLSLSIPGFYHSLILASEFELQPAGILLLSDLWTFLWSSFCKMSTELVPTQT